MKSHKSYMILVLGDTTYPMFQLTHVSTHTLLLTRRNRFNSRNLFQLFVQIILVRAGVLSMYELDLVLHLILLGL